jgi:hypothetical protein
LRLSGRERERGEEGGREGERGVREGEEGGGVADALMQRRRGEACERLSPLPLPAMVGETGEALAMGCQCKS